MVNSSVLKKMGKGNLNQTGTIHVPINKKWIVVFLLFCSPAFLMVACLPICRNPELFLIVSPELCMVAYVLWCHCHTYDLCQEGILVRGLFHRKFIHWEEFQDIYIPLLTNMHSVKQEMVIFAKKKKKKRAWPFNGPGVTFCSRLSIGLDSPQIPNYKIGPYMARADFEEFVRQTGLQVDGIQDSSKTKRWLWSVKDL